MTDPHGAQGAGHGQVRSEEDRISTGRVVAVGLGALILFFLASAVTLSWLRVKEGDRPPLPIPAEAGRSKIGMVEMQLFETVARGERDRAARLQRLRSYGWVDRRAGVVHMPIDRAMDLVVQGVRPSPAPPPAAAAPPGGQP